mgnify:FL=1
MDIDSNLELLTRRELQTRCKALGIKANGRTVVLIESLRSRQSIASTNADRTSSSSTSSSSSSSSSSSFASLARWLGGVRGESRALVVLLVALVCVVPRYLTSLGGYSGAATPPMFGDYEAQRHWMEITVNLPIGDWYRNTTENDLQYWGLDYPPLSAYLAKGLGHVARHPKVGLAPMVALRTSRGYESVASKLFMRLTVLALDIVLFFPAVWRFVALDRAGRGGSRRRASRDDWARALETVALVLLQPGFILVDHGHFQYNCVALALALWATVQLLRPRAERREVAASVLFVLALLFKHMALYFAPAFFFYLLACCAHRARATMKLAHLVKIGGAVLITAALCVGPLCVYAAPGETCAGGVAQLIARLFPFQRGLFEDKVANVWCTLDVALKLRRRFARGTLAVLALGATLLGVLPSGVELLRRPPTPRRFVYALFNASMAFFLFSYQVHEKSILLPLLPAALLFTGDAMPTLALHCGVVAAFSMFPLLRRDGHAIAYVATQALFLLVALNSDALAEGWRRGRGGSVTKAWRRRGLQLSVAAMLVLHIGEATLAPPARFPDLWPVLFAALSCAHFCVFYLIVNVEQWRMKEKVE